MEALSAVQRGQRDGGWGEQLLKEESMFTAALQHQRGGEATDTTASPIQFPQHELTVGWQLCLTLPCSRRSGHSLSGCCCSRCLSDSLSVSLIETLLLSLPLCHIFISVFCYLFASSFTLVGLCSFLMNLEMTQDSPLSIPLYFCSTTPRVHSEKGWKHLVVNPVCSWAAGWWTACLRMWDMGRMVAQVKKNVLIN